MISQLKQTLSAQIYITYWSCTMWFRHGLKSRYPYQYWPVVFIFNIANIGHIGNIGPHIGHIIE